MTPGRPPHFGDACLVLSAALAAGVILDLAASGPAAPAWARQVVQVGVQLSWIALPLAYARLAGIDLRSGLGLRLPGAATLARVAVSGVALVWLTLGLQSAQTEAFDRLGLDFSPQARASERQVQEIRAVGIPYALIVIGLLASAGEETLFRGIVLAGFARSFSPARGALYSALLFAVVHLTLPRMTTTFAIGLVLAAVFLWTRSLIATMILHALHNVGSLALAALGTGPPPPILLAAAGTALALALYSLHGRRAPPPSPVPPRDES